MSGDSRSIFREQGFKSVIAAAHDEIRELYLADETPWVIGYSGGKDSTAILQLCWNAVADLPHEQRTKPIHVISTDTLVENPVVALWVNRSLEVMADAAARQTMPVVPHRLTPKVTQTFWVNLIGRGYPAPRLKFRWCTERLKIHPSNEFIRQTVQENGEAILVLGTRTAESSKRAATMARHAKKSVRERLTPNASMQNSLIYTPIESWSNDDVWMYLMQVKNPWGYNNKDLLTMYQGATADGECPLVVDTNTPSCGNSRFGCWVCTLVDEDKSMTAMVQNDIEKEWMAPLLAIRNELDFRSDAARQRDQDNRDMRRMTGQVQYFEDQEGRGRLIKGPYTQQARAHWLKRLLETQRLVRERGPEEVRDWDLITPAELEEIRRIWISEKHEIEDLLPGIYEEATGVEYPGPRHDEDPFLNRESLGELRAIVGENALHYELVRNLLDIEHQYRNRALRRGLFHDLKQAISKCFYDSEDDALERARHRASMSSAEDADRLREMAANEGASS
jgi:DNA sulfur modification protein DndC